MPSENPENPIRYKQETKHAEKEAADHSQQTQSPTPPMVAPPETKPCPQHPEITCNIKRDWIDKLTMALEAFGLIVLIIYAGATIAIWCANKKAADAAHDTLIEIQKQTTMIRQQLVGTQAAVVVIAEYPGIELPNYGFNIGLRNDGHVVASKVKVALTAQKEDVSSAKPIEEPWHCDFDLPPILPTKVGEHQCFLQGLNQRSWQPIGEFKQTIAVNGRFSYWNGFDDVLSQPICLRYVPSGIKSKFGSEGPGSFVTCDRYPGWAEYLKERMAGNGEIQQPPRQ